MKQVISYSLYGDSNVYIVGALKNVALAQKIYPEHTVRFYVGEDVPLWVTETLEMFPNVEIKDAPKNNKWFSSAWRFLAFADREVDIVLVRDVDARLTVRERKAYDAWLDSGRDFHVMKDHPMHNAWRVSAGMWGGWADKMRNIATHMGEFMKGHEGHGYGVDQEFINEKLADKILANCLMHDSYFSTELKKPSICRQFPTKLENPANHVGAALNENDYYRYSEDEGLSVLNNGSGRFEYDLDLLEEY